MTEVYVACLDCSCQVLRDHPARKLCAGCKDKRAVERNRRRSREFYAANRSEVLRAGKEKRAQMAELNIDLPVPGVDVPRRLCKKCGEPLSVRRDNGTAKGYNWHCKPCVGADRRKRYANDPEYRAKVLARCRADHERRYAESPEYRAAIAKRSTESKRRMYRDPERHRRNLDAQKAWRERGQNRRGAVLRHKYGIDLPDYERMYAEQQGCCKICGTDKPGQNQNSSYSFHVDHCHKTGKVRGLLCDKCNRGLGYFNDNPLLLQQAIAYLNGGNQSLVDAVLHSVDERHRDGAA
jgi:hypothetical protein